MIKTRKNIKNSECYQFVDTSMNIIVNINCFQINDLESWIS